jgi:hypothetical protein
MASERFVKGNKLIEIQEGPPGYYYIVKSIKVVSGGNNRSVVEEFVYQEERKVLLPIETKPSVLEKLKSRGYKHVEQNRSGGKKSENSGGKKSESSGEMKFPPRSIYKKGNDMIEIIFTPPDKFLVRTTQKIAAKNIDEIFAKIKAEKWSVEKKKVDPAQKYLDRSLIGAINDKDVKSVVALLENGADPNMAVVKKNIKVLTPLHQAVRVQSPEIVAALLNMGADPNVTASEMKTTPLMNAIWFSDKKTAKKAAEIAKILIAKGADLNIKNAKGHSAIDSIRRKETLDKIKDFSKLI